MNAEFHIAIHYLSGLSTKEKLLLADLFDDLDDIRSLDRHRCESLITRRLRSSNYDPESAVERAKRDGDYLTSGRFGYTFYWETGYPPLLREIHDPPFLLFVRGEVREFDAATVSVVGTRYPTGRGKKSARNLGMEFADLGVPVVSGLAYGIDEAVHRGVVERGGEAYAVLGNGIDTIYPAEHRSLADRIIGEGGCILSEYGPGVGPRKYRFPARNRIIAGFSRGTVVVEAPLRSGALITADFALDDGRDLFVHRDGISGPNREGAARLVNDGARTIDHAGDVAEEWSMDRTPTLLASRMN